MDDTEQKYQMILGAMPDEVEQEGIIWMPPDVSARDLFLETLKIAMGKDVPEVHSAVVVGGLVFHFSFTVNRIDCPTDMERQH